MLNKIKSPQTENQILFLYGVLFEKSHWKLNCLVYLLVSVEKNTMVSWCLLTRKKLNFSSLLSHGAMLIFVLWEKPHTYFCIVAHKQPPSIFELHSVASLLRSHVACNKYTEAFLALFHTFRTLTNYILTAIEDKPKVFFNLCPILLSYLLVSFSFSVIFLAFVLFIGPILGSKYGKVGRIRVIFKNFLNLGIQKIRHLFHFVSIFVSIEIFFRLLSGPF